ncbi:MAG: hypothetical protein PHO27_12620 [Sulfuricurvum sp.]|nr:hypothetical protein [Sulfuricurvum sp.]
MREELKEVIGYIKQNADHYKIKKIFFSKLLNDDEKNAILELIEEGYGPKSIYTELVNKEILPDGKYSAFYRWLKPYKVDKNKVQILPTKSDSHLVETDNNPSTNSVENFIVNGTETVGINNSALNENNIDSRELFYGFDMNNQPDNLTNPIPIRPELHKESVCDIFLNDRTLNNEKIVRMLLCSIDDFGESHFINVWRHLLMKDDEDQHKYYERLRNYSRANPQNAYEIFMATSQYESFAIASNYYDLKPIKVE